MSNESRVILTAQEMGLALQRIALQILEHIPSASDLAIVGIHTCGVDLAERIRKIIQEQEGTEISYGSLDITLYRDDWSLISQNPVVRTTDIPFSVEGRRLILVDDVLFTGRTIRAAMEAIMDYGRPHSIQLAVLVDRSGRELPIQADYIGMQATVLPDEHIQVLLKEHGGHDQVVIQRKS
ncbi:MAG: bifunctional pyr operon transcriptional regulator/uracil phosphoribosyltransferase PyrR [Desulfoarculaceae bacterium]|nr:bifunctional pyr operon transcriptional regulator/uracil phosphoribosyltransferase PyrR [Desulfoarculaceae bacterium]